MKIHYWPIEKIIPYARNARKIPPKAVDKVAHSIQSFGWRQPVVVDGAGVIICGHTRWLAARKLGLERVPVHQADNLTPAQVKAYRLMDNRSHQETDWDFELLGEELFELRDLEMDFNLTGFDPHEIDTLLLGGADEDERANQVPELPESPVTISGDLWLCGPHRALCADATAPDARKANWCGDRRQSTVWQVANLNSFGGNRLETPTGHGTQKPVELMRRPIVNHTKRGDRVYDPFLGSGTMLIAAQRIERICFGIDIDPRYVDVTVQRWEQFSGVPAKLAGNGQTFQQVREARGR